ncbi:hypothetical protein [Oceanobacter mangrovi]|uniref:hypothetical protein n=1 Tax=Oceanobacter mangrovi TaxID=2862510 RepID=UPI001C8D474C|nr:hypothetical protein [Oceanobacter mangrovi]
MAMVLVCDSPVVTADNTVQCAAWQTVEFDQIALTSDLTDWDTYLGLDVEVFGQVVVGLLVTFVTGHVTGVVVRLMNRA